MFDYSIVFKFLLPTCRFLTIDAVQFIYVTVVQHWVSMIMDEGSKSYNSFSFATLLFLQGDPMQVIHMQKLGICAYPESLGKLLQLTITTQDLIKDTEYSSPWPTLVVFNTENQVSHC